MEPGQAERFDYRRKAPATYLSSSSLWRDGGRVKVTERRTKIDFAHCMKNLVDVHFP